jgi:hypothetical protein
MILPTIYTLQKYYSDREIVPRDIAQRARKEGVVQKDKNGDWRIISFKQNPPEFWDAHYDSKEDAEKALGAYHAQKHYSSYDKISDEDLEDEVYKRAIKKHRRRTLLKGALLGGIGGALTGWLKHKFGFGIPSQASKSSLIGAGIGALSGALGGYSWGKYYQNQGEEMNSPQFQRILKKEYEKAYKNRPHLTNTNTQQPQQNNYEEDEGTDY